jgi:hypothetical protein
VWVRSLILLTARPIIAGPLAPTPFTTFPHYAITSELLEFRKNFFAYGSVPIRIDVREFYTKSFGDFMDYHFLI